MKRSKWIVMVACLLAITIVLAGCKKKEEPPQIVEAPPETQAQIDQGNRSVTTGKITEKNNLPIMVSIPNDSSARPHVGISKADIVYEMYVEGGITRLLATYNDQMPDKVGPVRSARFYMVDIQDDWRAAFVHYGGPRASNAWSLYNRIKISRIKHRIDGTKDGRHTSRDQSRKAPNNAFVDLKAFNAEINDTATGSQPMKFSEAPTVGTADVGQIELEYSSSNKIKYVYDGEKKSYGRFVNDAEYVDGDGSGQVFVENIILQNTKQTNYGDVKGHINLDMLGSGKATFYLGGKMIEGSWERPDRTKPTVYKDASGNEMKFSVGHTFVQIVTDAVPVKNS